MAISLLAVNKSNEEATRKNWRYVMSKLALVTGATSGIGKATAELFAENGINLIVCGRRADRLEKLVAKLKDKVSIHSLCFDVGKREDVVQAINSLPDEFKQIDFLINNAGNAHGRAPFDQGSAADWEAMIDSNLKGLLYVTKAVLPGMVERKSGHVVNVGSIAGKEVYAEGNVYCASKHAVDALSKGMLIDLVKHGIKVTAIHPGLVDTEFSLVRFKGDEDRAADVYQGMKPLSGADVADVIFYTISLPEHVNIPDLTLFPTAQASATIVHRS